MISACIHEQTKVELLPPNQEHLARVVCTACDITLCYRAHPNTLAKRQQNAANIQKLLTLKISSFERGFLIGVRNHKPTPSQQQMLDSLIAKYILNHKRSNSSDKSEHITGQRAELATA